MSKFILKMQYWILITGILGCGVVQLMRVYPLREAGKSWSGWKRDYSSYCLANKALAQRKIEKTGLAIVGLGSTQVAQRQELGFYFAQNVMTDVVVDRGCSSGIPFCLVYGRDLIRSEISCPPGFTKQEKLSKHLLLCFVD